MVALGTSPHHLRSTNGFQLVALHAHPVASALMASYAVSASTQVTLNFYKRPAEVWLVTGLLIKFVEFKETLELLSTALRTGTFTLASVVLNPATKTVLQLVAVVAPTGGRKVSKYHKTHTPKFARTRTQSGNRTCNQDCNG